MSSHFGDVEKLQEQVTGLRDVLKQEMVYRSALEMMVCISLVRQGIYASPEEFEKHMEECIAHSMGIMDKVIAKLDAENLAALDGMEEELADHMDRFGI